jgi:hypothetical protein
MGRRYQVRFEFQNEYGWWMSDVLNNNGSGFQFWEADAIKGQLVERENVRNVQISDMSETRHW